MNGPACAREAACRDAGAPSFASRIGALFTEETPAATPAVETMGRVPSTHVPSLGELKARRREEHVCLRCNHHLVCGMAQSLNPHMLVIISHCLGFEPTEDEDNAAICELVPIEPLSTP